MAPTFPKTPRAVFLCTFTLGLVLYLPSLSYDFAWDDHYLVVENTALHNFESAGDWFVSPWAAGSESSQGREQNALYWRPFTQASYALDWVLGGGSPSLFHLTNSLLHGLVSGLVALLLWLLWIPLGNRVETQGFGALLGGVLFAVHPLHTEAVYLITYRTTLLASLGVLGALVLHLQKKHYLVVLIPFAMGLMAKEEAIVVPPLLVLLDLNMGRFPTKWGDILRRYTPVALLSAAYLVLHSQLTGGAQLDFFSGQESDTVVFTMLKVFWLDVRLLFVPWPLTPFYDWTLFPYAHHPFHGEVFLGASLLAGSLYFCVRSLIRRAKSPAFLWIGFFLIALLPYTHVVPFFDVAGERFLYLPSVAFCGFAAMLATRWMVSFPRLTGVVTLTWILFFVGLTLYRGPDFQHTRSLLEATQSYFPRSFSAAYELGRAELKAEKPEKAEAQFRRAFKALPLEIAALCAAESLRQQGKWEEAIAYLETHKTTPSGALRPQIAQVLQEEASGGGRTPIRCDLGTMLETDP